MVISSTYKPGAVPFKSELIRRGDNRIDGYNHDTMMTGNPDALVRPADAQECQEIVAYCAAQKIPLTFCGGHTAMTGSGVAESGLLLSIEKMSGVREIATHHGRSIAKVLPGTFLGDFQRTVERAGFFYPPSPTSRNEAMIGATVATNATGDNTYKYGTTRKYIRAIDVILPDGSQRTITRPAEQHVAELKNTAGYFLHGSEIDYFIGSEGTLGLITEVTVDLLTAPHPAFGLFVFFPTNDLALEAILRAHHDDRVNPTALEYIDDNALRLMATHPTFAKIPESAQAALIIYQEADEATRDPLMQAWLDLLSNLDPRMTSLLDHAIITTQTGDEERLRTWRHHIPAHVNEIGHHLESKGGGKVGSDWWVPIDQMRAMMDFMYARSRPLGIPFLAFGHLGNGHPHVNYLTRNPEEKARAKAMVVECCKHAVSLGGGVAGEHGLGKLKRDLLALQHPPAVIEQMYALKTQYDPHWIFGRGNILRPPT